MKKNLMLLASSALIALTFSVPKSIHGMEYEQENPQGIQREASPPYEHPQNFVIQDNSHECMEEKEDHEALSLHFDLGNVNFGVAQQACFKGTAIFPQRLPRDLSQVEEAERISADWLRDNGLVTTPAAAKKFRDLKLVKLFGFVTPISPPPHLLLSKHAALMGNLLGLVLIIDDHVESSIADHAKLKKDLGDIISILSGDEGIDITDSPFNFLLKAITSFKDDIQKNGNPVHFLTALREYFFSIIYEKEFAATPLTMPAVVYQTIRRKTVALAPFIELFVLVCGLKIDRDHPIINTITALATDSVYIINDIISFAKEVTEFTKDIDEYVNFNTNIIGIIYSAEKDLQKSFGKALQIHNEATLNFIESRKLIIGNEANEKYYNILSCMMFDHALWSLSETTRYTSHLLKHDFSITPYRAPVATHII